MAPASRLQAVNTEPACRAVLRVAFPDLRLDGLRYLAEGWDSTVFEVNGAYVFRFPKRAGVDATLRKEIRLLPEVGPALPKPIPWFEYVSGPSPIYTWHVVGYRKLSGTPLSEFAWRGDDAGDLVPALAAFLRALHTFPVARAAELGAPVYSPGAWRDRHEWLFEAARQAAEPLLPPAVLGRFAAAWRMLSDADRFDFEPVMIHGDLAMEHVLVDDKGGLSGVIDFGDAMVADPALDFAGFPAQLAHAVLPLYSANGSIQKGIWLRRDLLRRAAPLHAISAGVELARADLVRSGIEQLRQAYG